MSQESSSNNSSNNRRRPRRRNSAQNAGGQQNRSQQGKNQSRGNRSRNNNRRRNNNRSRHPKVKFTGFDRVVNDYLKLLDRYLEVRRKYFAQYLRADKNLQNKLQRQLDQALGDIRKYEEGLAPDDLERFKKNYTYVGTEDLIYSENRSLAPEDRVDQAPEGPFEDPHLLPSQKESSFSEDDEMSSGTMDDYRKYKGI